MWYLLAGSRGGPTRARILWELKMRPRNAHQLAVDLGFDYKTVQHHLLLMVKHRLVVAINPDNYGQMYIICPELEILWLEFGDIWAQFGSDLGKSK